MKNNILKNLAYRFTDRLATHPLFNQYFQSVDDFIDLTGLENNELSHLFTQSDEQLFEHFVSLGEKLYKRYEPPFIDVVNFLDFASHELIIVIHKQQLDITAEKVTHINELLQNAIAKSYFHQTLKDIKLTSIQSKEESYSPLAIHFDWLLKVSAFLNNESSELPETDHLICRLADWLKTMEFEMHLDSMREERETNHAKVHLTHRKIHMQFNYILSFIKIREYTLALSHLSILYQSVLELERHLRNLQFNYVHHEESNFYYYIENKSFEEENLYYFVSIQLERWKHVSVSALTEEDLPNSIKKDIEQSIRLAGIDGVVLLKDKQFRLFLQNKGAGTEEKVETFLSKILHPLLERYAEDKNSNIRTLGVNLDNLNEFPEHKIAMLQQLPVFKTKEAFKVISRDEVQVLFDLTIKSYKTAQCVTQALTDNKLEVFFQPIVKNEHSEKIYVEALVRAPKDDGYLSAEDFLGYIINADKMLELDLFVIGKIKQHLPDLKKVTSKVSINIYPTSFKNDHIINALIDLSKAFTNNGMALVVEITEQLFLTDTDNVIYLATEHGIEFSLDDFGSGYSNLLQLIDLAERDVLHVLKIDGGLVKNIEHDEKIFKIIETITQITNILGITPVIMEYVENEKILNKLETLNANIFYQGFYFSKALSIDNLIEKYSS